MTNYVLVHGSFGGGWVWQKVSPLLRNAGAEVHVPRLTGVSDRSHLLQCGIDLTTHITDVASFLNYEDLSEVVLVGHSYAGMVITGVADQVPGRLKQLVYLDAYVPKAGESEVDLWPAEWRDALGRDEAAGRGVREPLSPAGLGINDPELAEWVAARMTPHPLATYTEPVSATGAASATIPRVFIHCTEGQLKDLFATFAEEARIEGWKVYELPSGHAPMLTAPEALAELLLQVVDV